MLGDQGQRGSVSSPSHSTQRAEERRIAVVQEEQRPDDGAEARKRWAQLPPPVDPQQCVTTQALDRDPDSEPHHDLSRTVLLWGAG